MSELTDHPALARLARLEQRWDEEYARHKQARRGMGYQPALDGVRAVSVIAVILYHAGFEWMHGGFFGVEVFFVVSGFLITSLLIEERDRTHAIALKKFWQRRFRRLLPALAAMFVAVGIWAALWGSAEQHSQLRRDFPWGIFYFANWGQIIGDTPYFSPSPALLRHVWSLAVEEQWYLIWPLAFVAITRHKGDDRRRGLGIAAVSLAVMVLTALAAAGDWPSISSNESFHVNFLYLSTLTRCSGLLLGAALAFWWRPWRAKSTAKASGKAGAVLDVAAGVAVAVLLASFFVGRWNDDATYLWLLPLVSIASAVLVAVVVHPWAAVTRRVLGARPLVEIGKRSYGLYLWSWPISRVCEAFEGSWSRFGLAMLITIPVNELCYRFLETPIRSGAIARWWAAREGTSWRGVLAVTAAATMWLAGSMTYFFSSADAVYDAAKDTGADLQFDPNAIADPSGSTAPNDTAATPSSEPSVSTLVTTTTLPTSTTLATLPRKMVILGDSTAHALAINLPDGIETTFTIGDGAISGCSVYSGGTALSSIGYKRQFGGCEGWAGKWVADAQEVSAEVALVVLGAWDVFDVQLGDTTVAFASEQSDERFVTGMQEGVDALSAIGVKVALLEVPCMRPQDVVGQGTPPLPERGDDTRVAHVNELLRQVAAANPATTTFVTGAQEYCTDPTIASSLAYRWDGVHSYKPGAKLTIEAIAAQLLAIPYP